MSCRYESTVIGESPRTARSSSSQRSPSARRLSDGARRAAESAVGFFSFSCETPSGASITACASSSAEPSAAESARTLRGRPLPRFTAAGHGSSPAFSADISPS